MITHLSNDLVRDCEHIRKMLLGHKSDPEDQKWTILGQSYGGFCSLTYLSFFPGALKEVFLTGGLAPITKKPDPVYEKTKCTRSYLILETFTHSFYLDISTSGEEERSILPEVSSRCC